MMVQSYPSHSCLVVRKSFPALGTRQFKYGMQKREKRFKCRLESTMSLWPPPHSRMTTRGLFMAVLTGHYGYATSNQVRLLEDRLRRTKRWSVRSYFRLKETESPPPHRT